LLQQQQMYLGTSFKLINVLDPTLAQDAATKNYVDTALNSSNDLAIANVWVILVVKLAVPLSGAVTIDNTGLVAIVDDANDSKDFRRYDSSR
jgi:hypothetical protein